jgi:hypothetical protein
MNRLFSHSPPFYQTPVSPNGPHHAYIAPAHFIPVPSPAPVPLPTVSYAYPPCGAYSYPVPAIAPLTPSTPAYPPKGLLSILLSILFLATLNLVFVRPLKSRAN